MKTPSSPAPPGRTGLWIVGARGSIATCVAVGLEALASGRLAPTGLASAHAPLADLPWVGFDQLVLGGAEARAGRARDAAAELVAGRVLSAELAEAAGQALDTLDTRIVPGLVDRPAPDRRVEAGDAEQTFDARVAELAAQTPRERIAHVVAALDTFRREQRLERLIVVDLSSTESTLTPRPEWDDLARFEAALDAGQAQPASLLYAYAAFAAGAAHVNFTPNLGASVAALRTLAHARGLPHCGNDGKTGETLVKTALAPMFAARSLNVLSWVGYNMLGNRDGEVLAEPLHKRAKVENKDEALRQILRGQESLHSHVGIDYVPAFGDWKTAWDHVHFEGFLGARMSLQFTWAGCDSALAAPLVLDLVRLTELALRRGEIGAMTHTASFFKSPLDGGSHDFHQQHRRLLEWAQTLSR
jgi:myo-inositol-1-phosphate synthase